MPIKRQKIIKPKKKLLHNTRNRINTIEQMNEKESQLGSIKKAYFTKMNRKQDSDYVTSSSDSSSNSDSEEFTPVITARPKKIIDSRDKKLNFKDEKIIAIPTNKDCFEERPLSKHQIIPRQFSSFTIIVGSIGSGKSNLLINLLMNPIYYGKDKTGKPTWDNIFMFTNSHDDLQETLIENKIIPKTHIKHLPEPKDLKVVLDKVKKQIKEADGDMCKVPITTLIFDDIQDSKEFLESKEFKTICCRPRQYFLQIFLLLQYYNTCPKVARMQCTNMIAFSGNRLESEIYEETFNPAGATHQQFQQLLKQVWEKTDEEPFPYLHIVRKQPIKTRFRRGFFSIIDITE